MPTKFQINIDDALHASLTKEWRWVRRPIIINLLMKALLFSRENGTGMLVDGHYDLVPREYRDVPKDSA